MQGPRAQNWNGESSDSCDDQHPSVTVQTEWSRVQGTNYQLQESTEESGDLHPCYMIGHKVYKKYGEKLYEGSLESYNVETDMFKVLYENGCFDELKGNDLISYLVRHRNKDGDQSASPSVPEQQSEKLPCGNNGGGDEASPVAPAQPSAKSPRGDKGGGENASPSAPVQPSRKLPSQYATGKMATGDSNDELRMRTRPLMMTRAANAGGSSQPRRAAHVQPASEVGIQGGGRKRALRMRAINAGDINPPRPRPARKPKVVRPSRRSLLYEEYKKSAYIYYDTDEDEDTEDTDWKE